MLKKIGAILRDFIGRLRGDRFDLSGDFRGATVNVKPITERIMEIRPWAWLVGIAILALALLLFAGIFNIGPIRSLLPTPTAFAPAHDNESLIIVADFEDRSKGQRSGFDPAQRIFEQLHNQVEQEGLQIRVERLYEPVTQNSVDETGAKYNASLILWGWYDVESIAPTLERLKLQASRSFAESPDQYFAMAEPKTIEFRKILNADLPSRATYLTWFAFGLDAYTNHNDNKALSYFDSALAAVPKDREDSTNPAESYFFRGNVYFYKRDYERAIADYGQVAHRLKPGDAGAYNNLGVAYDFANDFNNAILNYNEAITRNLEYADAYLNRGVAYDRHGDLDLAIKDYSHAISLTKDDAGAYYNRGLAYIDQINYDNAIKDFDKAIDIKKDFANAYYNRGRAYAYKNYYDYAIDDFNQVIKLQPHEASNYFARGLVFIAQNKREQSSVTSRKS